MPKLRVKGGDSTSVTRTINEWLQKTVFSLNAWSASAVQLWHRSATARAAHQPWTHMVPSQRTFQTGLPSTGHALPLQLSVSAPFSLRPLVDGKKMDLPLARLRSLLVPKFAFWAAIGFPKFNCLHHMFKSWTVLICWESLCTKETTHIKHAFSPVFPLKRDIFFPKMVRKSSIDLGIPLCAFGDFAVSIHVRLNQPMMRLQQCNFRQRMLLERKLQSTQCQTFELDTTPRLVGRLRCVHAKSCPLTMPLTDGPQGRFGGFSLTPFYRSNCGPDDNERTTGIVNGRR